MMAKALSSTLERVSGDLTSLKVRAVNGLRYLGGEEFGKAGATPRRQIWDHHGASVYRYDSLVEAGLPPVLIVHSLVSLPYVFDLQPGNSLVEDLTTSGYDVYLLEWGTPRPVDAANTIETYTDEYLPLAIEAVLADAGTEDLDVISYCLGSILAALAIAGNDLPVSNLVMLAPPIDWTKMEVTHNLLGQGRIVPTTLVDETGNVPAESLVTSFRMLAPTTDLTTFASLWHSLLDESVLHSHKNLLHWSGTHIPFPGATFQQIVDLFLHQGTLVTGIVPLGGREVRLSDIRSRVLVVTGERDFMVPQSSTAPVDEAFAPAPVEHLRLKAGHTGLFVGRSARKNGVPAIIGWLQVK